MAIIDRRTAWSLDRYLDALSVGDQASIEEAGLDRELASTVHRVHSLVALAAGPTERTKARIVGREPSSKGDALSAVPMSGSYRQGRFGVLVATAVSLLLVGMAGAYVVRSLQATPATLPAASAPPAIYVPSADGTTLQPIDPVSLADRPGAGFPATPQVVGTPADGGGRPLGGYWIGSTDGSTLVHLALFQGGPTARQRYGRAIVTVFDRRTGTVRSQFEAPTWHSTAPMLTPDGRFVVFEGDYGLSQGGGGKLVLDSPPVWYVVDSRDGRTVATIRGDDTALSSLTHIGYLDPQGERLYHLTPLGSPDTLGPWPARLVVHDLATGREIGHLDLPGIGAGFWWTGEKDGTGPSATYRDAFLTPTIAFSPDGATVYVLDGSGSEVAVVDARTLAVERSVSLSLTPVRAFDIAVGDQRDRAIGYATHLTTGSDVRALVAPDGDHLVLAGVRRSRADAGATIHVEDLGVQTVDLRSGRATARAAITNWFWGWQWSWLAGPRTLYVEGLDSTALFEQGIAAPLQLWRLDAQTLTVLAHRQVPGPVVVTDLR